MSGHRPFSDLMKDWSPERRARSDARQEELAADMVSLEQLREGLGISQEELAKVMECNSRPSRSWSVVPT
jgi:DNA-binding transcriptional regulator YiaG